MRYIYVMWDSISKGWGKYFEEISKWFFVYSRLNENWWDSNNILRNLKNQNIPSERDILLLNCWLHDIRKKDAVSETQVKKEDYEKNLIAIFSEAKKYFKKIIWISSTPVYDSIHNSRDFWLLRFQQDIIEYNFIASSLTEKNNIPIIDLYSFTENLWLDIFIDHVHFREDIKQSQAEFIFQNII